jgi:hypothetical protein
MDYNSLIIQIQNWANRTDQPFTSEITNFINQGINRIYSEAKNIGFEVTVQSTLTQGNSVISKPASWRETISFYITDNREEPVIFDPPFLLLRSRDFCQTYWPNNTLTSPPKFYADYGNNSYYISPTPDYAYPFQLTYLSLPLFNVDNPQNFLTERYPRLLFYACMVEAEPFLKDDERVPVFKALYNEALQDINNDTKERYTDRVSKRDKD